jgi:Rieske Fe-S protein
MSEHDPAWRRDFPLEIPQEQYVARRDFTKFLGLTSLAFVVGQVWIGIQNWFRKQRGQPPIRPIAHLQELPVGGVVPFSYPGESDRCLLLRPAPDQLVAYDQKCTHLSCAVVPGSGGDCLLCPCHQGLFEKTTGRPIAGPPRRPLTRIQLEIRDDDVVCAVGVERRSV